MIVVQARRCGLLFFFKQKTAYEMRISDWSSDVCSSDLGQSEELVQTVAVFKLADDGSSDPAAYAQDQSHGRTAPHRLADHRHPDPQPWPTAAVNMGLLEAYASEKTSTNN